MHACVYKYMSVQLTCCGGGRVWGCAEGGRLCVCVQVKYMHMCECSTEVQDLPAVGEGVSVGVQRGDESPAGLWTQAHSACHHCRQLQVRHVPPVCVVCLVFGMDVCEVSDGLWTQARNECHHYLRQRVHHLPPNNVLIVWMWVC